MKIEELKNIFHGVPFNEYRAMGGLNFHTLKDFCEDPFRFHDGWYADNQKDSDALRIGKQFHELLLQGEEVFNQNNALWTPPVNPKTEEPYGTRTKKYLDALSVFEAESAGKLPYTSRERTIYNEMFDECQRNECVAEVLRPFDSDGLGSEVVFQGELLPGLTVKGSIDRLDNEVGIVDLKTTSVLTPYFWGHTVYSFWYVEQLAFYQLAVKEVCGADEYPDAYIVAVETKDLFRSAVMKLSEEVMAHARAFVYDMICRYLNATHSGVYKGPYDEQQVITYYPVERMKIQ